MPDEDRIRASDDDTTERAIVLQVLRDDHPERWTRTELKAELSNLKTCAIDRALRRLEAHGVVHVDGEVVRALRCARRIDYLGLIGV